MGNTDGMFKLGICYDKGNGVSQDKQKAIELYQRASDMGNTHAKNILVVCSAAGIGVSQNKKKSVESYKNG